MCTITSEMNFLDYLKQNKYIHEKIYKIKRIDWNKQNAYKNWMIIMRNFQMKGTNMSEDKIITITMWVTHMHNEFHHVGLPPKLPLMWTNEHFKEETRWYFTKGQPKTITHNNFVNRKKQTYGQRRRNSKTAPSPFITCCTVSRT